ncbi:hypothetical protein OFN71_38600, partial [Escherichia coli]|nr:hypothetical protein [Escherichia coli]
VVDSNADAITKKSDSPAMPGSLLSKRGFICFVNHFQNNFSGIKPSVDLSHLDIFRIIGAYLSQEFFIPKAFLAAALTG